MKTMLAVVAVMLAGCAIPWERYYADKTAWDAGWYAINDGPLCGHRYDPRLSWEENSRQWDECTAALRQYVAEHPQPALPHTGLRPRGYLVM